MRFFFFGLLTLYPSFSLLLPLLFNFSPLPPPPPHPIPNLFGVFSSHFMFSISFVCMFTACPGSIYYISIHV